MNTITIKPLSSEINKDYLDFFDTRAFTDGNPNGPCYCTSPNQDEETIKKMVKKFKIFGVKKTLRKYAVKMLNENKIQGYLAFDGDVSIGWCNAADIESYSGFIPQFAKEILVERLFLSCVLKLPLNTEVKELHQLLSKEYVAMQRKRDTLQLKVMPNFPNKEMILISKVPSNFTKKPVLLKLQEKTDKLL